MNNTADRQDLLRSKKTRKAHQMIQGLLFFFSRPHNDLRVCELCREARGERVGKRVVRVRQSCCGKGGNRKVLTGRRDWGEAKMYHEYNIVLKRHS